MLLRYSTKKYQGKTNNYQFISYNSWSDIKNKTDDISQSIYNKAEKLKDNLPSVNNTIDAPILSMSEYMKRTEAVFVKEEIKDINISVSINVGVCSITVTKYINKE